MPCRGVFLSVLNFLVLAIAVWGHPARSIAQRHGGGHGGMGSGMPGGTTRPTGVEEKDSMKDFHKALAVQATSEQIAESQAMVKTTDRAQAFLQSFQNRLSKTDNGSEPRRQDGLDLAIQAARDGAKKFQDGFSTAQKSGLKEIVRRLGKSDSDLELEERKFDQRSSFASETVTHAESLDKALSDFFNQELALGQEMSIVLANGQDLAFSLPQTKSPLTIEGRTITVTVSGALSQTAVLADQRTFKLELLADLSDLQENITELLSSQLDTSETCGQRIAIRQASLDPASPASLLVVKVHFERWTCMRSFGQQSATELSEGDGSVEIKLTPTLDKRGLKIEAAFGRIDATGMFAEAIRSGSLGEDLREKAVQWVLMTAQAGSDFKIALPPAVRNSVVITSAKFQDAGVGALGLVLDGQIQRSDEQANQLASQVNQSPSAQGGTPQPPAR